MAFVFEKEEEANEEKQFWRCMWQLRGAQQKQLSPFYYYYHPIIATSAHGCCFSMMM
jgi:hypothetical protein